MRKLATLGLLLALGAAAVGVSIQLARTRQPSSIAPVPVDESAAGVPVDVAQGASSVVPEEPTSDERQAVARDSECRLFGVVVDDREQPLADVSAVLIADDGYVKREVRTDAEGRFEIRSPVPGKGICFFSLSSPESHEFVSREFGRKKTDPTLHAGDNDLGRFVLRRAAVIEGRVTLGDGTPVPYVVLALQDREIVSKRDARTGADGSYRIPGVMPGKYRITAGAGWASFPSGSTLREIEIVANETLAGVDLVLPCAGFIAGQVVDESGAPLARACVNTGSVEVGSRSVRRFPADDDGRFCVLLEGNQPQLLAASWLSEPADFDANEAQLIASRTASAVLVLTELPQAHFIVIDAVTRKPIERFGLRLTRPAGPDAEGAAISDLKTEAHSDGKCALAVASDERIVQISAPGYAARELRLTDVALHGGEQALEMWSGATIVGRVTLLGKPTSLGRARVSRAAVGKREWRRTEKSAPQQIERFDLTAFVGRPIDCSLDREGAFHLEDLAPGTYEFTVRGKSGARATLPPLRVAGGQRLDLGEIALAPGTVLRGRALLPPRVEPAGIRILAAGEKRTLSAKLDAQGRFDIDDLPAGRCTVTVPAIRGVLADGPPIELQLAPGEEREAVLDLRDREGMWLVVRVHSGGRAIQNSRVTYDDDPRSDAGSDYAAPRVDPGSRSVTNSDGEARSWHKRAERVRLSVHSPRGLLLAQDELEVSLASDGTARTEFEVETATLIVDWSGIAPVPEVIGVSCIVESMRHAIPNTALASIYDADERKQRRCELGLVSIGAREVRLVFTRPDRTSITYRRPLTCGAGEVIECVFTDADRVE